MERKYATEPQSVKTEDGKTAYKLAFKLAPCPFCGGNDLSILDDTGVIYCRTCSATGPHGEEGAGYAWNEWYYRRNGTTPKIARNRVLLETVKGNAAVINEIYSDTTVLRNAMDSLVEAIGHMFASKEDAESGSNITCDCGHTAPWGDWVKPQGYFCPACGKGLRTEVLTMKTFKKGGGHGL